MNDSTPSPKPADVARLVTWAVDGQVAIVTLDDPSSRHVTVTPAVLVQLNAALREVEGRSEAEAVVIRSAKKSSFCAGANLALLQELRFSSDAEGFAKELARTLGRIAAFRKPIVACVSGCALGAGFELALACSAIVATDAHETVFGLPEVRLGLLPFGNGLLRIAERSSLRIAADVGLRAQRLHVHEAWKRGLVDEIVEPRIALSAAREVALRLVRNPTFHRGLTKGRSARARALNVHPRRPPSPPRQPRFGGRAFQQLAHALVEANPVGRKMLFRRTRHEVQRRRRGTDEAASAIIDVLERYGKRGFADAARLEAERFADLVVTPSSRRLAELFFSTVELKKDLGLEPRERDIAREALAKPVERLGIVGSGMMGAGIAAASVRAGVVVDLRDADPVHLRRGLRFVHDTLHGLVARETLTIEARERAFDRLHGTTDAADFAHVSFAIEAVYEDLALKQRVLRELEEVVTDDCVLASNTSSIPIARLAEGARRPERILGMHYFRPAWAVPLVEVVRTPLTSPRALGIAIDLGRRQQKHVLVVNDGPGFFATRVMAPMLSEAVRMVSEGVPIAKVDEAAMAWGFAAGPLQIFDELGIDLALRIAEVLHEGLGSRAEVPQAFEALRTDDRRGKKNARGFYLHSTSFGRHGVAAPRPDPTVYEAIAATPDRNVSLEDVTLRSAMAFINEAVRCLSDGVLSSPRDGDIGAVIGLGFPAHRGGPFRTVDALGAAQVLRHLRGLEQRFGPRFEPAPLLVDMARHGRRFYD